MNTRSSYRNRIWSVALVAIVVACGQSRPSSVSDPTVTPATETVQAVEGCAHVVGGAIRRAADGTFAVDATVRSADTGWDKYADQWDVVDSAGQILATRVLAHPHEDEQPFTRSLSEVVIPESVELVTLQARDSVEGYCGETYDLEVNG